MACAICLATNSPFAASGFVYASVSAEVCLATDLKAPESYIRPYENKQIRASLIGVSGLSKVQPPFLHPPPPGAQIDFVPSRGRQALHSRWLLEVDYTCKRDVELTPVHHEEYLKEYFDPCSTSGRREYSAISNTLFPTTEPVESEQEQIKDDRTAVSHLIEKKDDEIRQRNEDRKKQAFMARQNNSQTQQSSSAATSQSTQLTQQSQQASQSQSVQPNQPTQTVQLAQQGQAGQTK